MTSKEAAALPEGALLTNGQCFYQVAEKFGPRSRLSADPRMELPDARTVQTQEEKEYYQEWLKDRIPDRTQWLDDPYEGWIV